MRSLEFQFQLVGATAWQVGGYDQQTSALRTEGHDARCGSVDITIF
jgi:hypothetical protein